MSGSQTSCDAAAGVNPFIALDPVAAKPSQWLAREIVLELCLAVLGLLFIISTAYMISSGRSSDDVSMQVGAVFVLLIGLLALSIPVASIAIQFNKLVDGAPK